MNFTFEVSHPLDPQLRGQVLRMAQALPEGMSRAYCPRLWTAVDWLRRQSGPTDRTMQRRIRCILGCVDLLLALAVLGPALIDPGEWKAVLVVGILCFAAGVLSLWTKHRLILAYTLTAAGVFYGIAGLGGGDAFRRLLALSAFLLLCSAAVLLPRNRSRQRRARKAADTLWQARLSLPENSTFRIHFMEHGLQVASGCEESPVIPYSDMRCIVESEDLILVGMTGKGLLLAKGELAFQPFPLFEDALSGRLTWIQAAGTP